MIGKVKNKWFCHFCESEIKAKPDAFNIVYTNEPDKAICPICGSHNLMKIEKIFSVE